MELLIVISSQKCGIPERWPKKLALLTFYPLIIYILNKEHTSFLNY